MRPWFVIIVVMLLVGMLGPMFYFAYSESHGVGENNFQSKAACEAALRFQHLDPKHHYCKQVP